MSRGVSRLVHALFNLIKKNIKINNSYICWSHVAIVYKPPTTESTTVEDLPFCEEEFEPGEASLGASARCIERLTEILEVLGSIPGALGMGWGGG